MRWIRRMGVRRSNRRERLKFQLALLSLRLQNTGHNPKEFSVS
jgi:hypothetical protein